MKGTSAYDPVCGCVLKLNATCLTQWCVGYRRSSRAGVVLYPCVHALKVYKMAGVVENISQSEILKMVSFLLEKRMSYNEINHRLVSVYGLNFQSKGSVCVIRQI
jgi:hypothetical protein